MSAHPASPIAIPPVPRLQAAVSSAHAPTVTGGGETTEFRRLLEQLESLTAPVEPDPVASVDAFAKAMKHVDAEFEQLMRVREQLLSAYRSKQ